MATQVIDILTTQYREHPGWTIQLHVDNLRAALKGRDTSMPSYPHDPALHEGARHVQPARPHGAPAPAHWPARDRLERLEVRSFELDHVSALWHLDFHHGSRKVLTRQGVWRRRCCWE